MQQLEVSRKREGQAGTINKNEAMVRFSLLGIFARMTVLVWAFLVLAVVPSGAETLIDDLSVLPPKYGTVIYQENPEAANQVYIVAQSHRSSVSGAIGAETDSVQAEIYRIGEWLALHRNVGLLLPEGYFGKSAKTEKIAGSSQRRALVAVQRQSLDKATLAELLADTSRFVNADMLLHRHLDLRLQQIEDRNLYFSVRELLSGLHSAPVQEQELILSILQYRQMKRSALILQNIPEVVAREFGEDRADSQNAMLTIGLAHVDDMVRFLTDGRAEVFELPDSAGRTDCGGYSGDLDRLKKEFGIAVIIPRTLAEKYYPQRMAKML